MSLIGTLTSGTSALQSFTKGLEVIGNNIANVNTVGFKGSVANFQESFSNTLRASAASTDTSSNLSAIQVGTGVKVASINANMNQGALSSTGVSTDLGISGTGFFVVASPIDGSQFATRAGDFRIDDKGFLVTTKGMRVQGLTGGDYLTAPGTVGNVRLRTSAEIAATWPAHNATNIASTAANATVAAAVDTSLSSLVTAAAGQNNATALTTATTALTAATTAETTAIAAAAAAPTDVSLATASAAATAVKEALAAAIAAGNSAVLGAPSVTSTFLTSLTTSSTTAAASKVTADAAALNETTPAGLQSYSFDLQGNVIEFYSDGSSATTNKLLLQNFKDPSALQRAGDNLFSGFIAAGPITGSTALDATGLNNPGNNGLGTIQAGTLELSNVDLTEQFANMITVQRSFQASSRIVTVSDSILEEVVNLKR
jgi:flagellar hook protein FlgE